MPGPLDANPSATRKLTERQVLEELGLDRLELYLLVSAERLGRHDLVSHLLVFTDAEVEALAARLGVVRRRRSEPSPAAPAHIPEPTGE